MAILAVNAGSSTLKFSLHPVNDGQVEACILTGSIQGLEPKGQPELSYSYLAQTTREILPSNSADPFETALERLSALLRVEHDLPPLKAIAHRIVHGGKNYRESLVLTDTILADLETLNSLAPLHQPHNIAGVRAFMDAFPMLPQIGCFDTAFHATLPEEEYSFALPAHLRQDGIRRYGFHGLSYQYLMGQLKTLSRKAGERVIMAHLGNGASLCATLKSLSLATTMGFSALDGLIMGTRSGALDAGVLLYLLEQGYDHAKIQTLLYKQSGLLGLSGLSADMRTLRAIDSEEARLAIRLFTHRIIRESGAMAACLQGLDAYVFSGGIGEHDVLLRAEICAALEWLGVKINPSANQQARGDQAMAIHSEDSAVEIWVIPTDEGRVAARDAAQLIKA
jgi:acetate kinase